MDGEILCSLKFASGAGGTENAKQADLTELFKYNQMEEKLRNSEKEIKELQESLQSYQLVIAAKEHICRNLQEKVRELENQLAEERKTRLKHETRALCTASEQFPSLKEAAQKTLADKKPPLGPSKLRQPLRRISNLPPPSPVPPKNTIPNTSADGKENMPKLMGGTALARRSLYKPRRISIAVRPPSPSTARVLQPRRRVSLATFRPESSTHMTTPLKPAGTLSMPPPSSVPPKQTIYTTSADGQENIPKSTVGTANAKSLYYKPRRISIAVRPPPPSTTQVLQPRRWVSLATLRPASNSYTTTPLKQAVRFSMRQPSPVPPNKTISTTSAYSKENIPDSTVGTENARSLCYKPRRISIAVRSPAPTATQVHQPRRRVSLATFRPESNTYLTTPLKPPQKATAEATPSARSRKFMASPPTHGSSKLRYRRPLVWSPLRFRGMKRLSLMSTRLPLPTRLSTDIQ
ncbi:hypothetical protein FNV43_RR04916 [Rhamnella rubrinervis]|uniref:Uncharacterized protein n=1 Tax=Rhamnella rubrinervis TaxID=2594499 RepID=A0A8K0HMZ4_9ROSA|nr:hypothetical protein FNV43_RR04916 [Rhamnella rubrinervis]